jgi:hypothetical protein
MEYIIDVLVNDLPSGRAHSDSCMNWNLNEAAFTVMISVGAALFADCVPQQTDAALIGTPPYMNSTQQAKTS